MREFDLGLDDPRRRGLLFIVLAAVAVGMILWLTRDLSFHGDEWPYIVDRRLTFESMVQPHNEHLAFLHVLVYRGLVELVGVGSYLPYLVVLMALHVSGAVGIFYLLRPRSEDGAFAAAVLFLFLGTGFDNLVWGFQIGFVGAMSLGVWSLVVARRPILCALLLTAAVATQGNGLFFIAPAAILITRRRWLLLPIGSYLAWLLLIGRERVSPPELGPAIEYGVRLIGSTVGGLAGFGVAVGVGLAVVLAILLVARGTWSPLVVAGIVGFGTELFLLAYGRAQFGPGQAESSRYIYVAAPFIFMILTGLRFVPRPVWAALFTVALVLNIWALPRGVALYQAFIRYDRSLTLEQRLAPWRDP